MSGVPNIIKDVVEAARSWLRAMNHFRRLVAEKTDPQVVEKARVQLVGASKKLEVAVLAFEKAYGELTKRKQGGPKQSFPWGKLLRGALKGAGAINDAMNKVESPTVVSAVEGEVVTPPSSKS